MDLAKIKEFAQHEEKKLESLTVRVYPLTDDRNQGRDEFMRDYARILYSSSFRRLQGKMQLLGINATNFNRNRLTHSLEVAQIARSIAQNLGIRNPVVTESCSLAHDLGNPPFGHYGEVILNELSADIGGFEGNAQTFRILRKLEKKHHEYEGLNLTIRTLLGVTKYFNRGNENNKKFLYTEDYDFLKSQLNKNNLTITKSIDAQIMDLSDEIAYAAHDLEDALSSGIISLGEIVHEFKISDDFSSAYEEFSKLTQKVQETALKCIKLKTSEEYSAVLRKELTSEIVNTLCQKIAIVKTKNNTEELGYKNNNKLAEGLKKLLFKTILRKKDIQHYEKKGEKIIRGLFEVYTDTSYNKNNILLPAELRILQNENTSNTRLVIDYISGMMDSYAEQEYIKYFGQGSLEQLYFKK
ncbi:MAG: dNTP triphosphohydrolase [Arcobacteraceae bacterium]